jgi:hypothetical protein
VYGGKFDNAIAPLYVSALLHDNAEIAKNSRQHDFAARQLAENIRLVAGGCRIGGG